MNGCFVKLLAGAALSGVVMFGATINTVNEKYGSDPAAPYTATLTGITGLSSATVICDDDIDGTGSNYAITETSLATIDSGGVPSYMEFGGTGETTGGKTYIKASTTTYQQAAYLAVEEMLYAANYSANSGIVEAIQTAIWDLFCTSGCASPVTDSGYAGGVGGLGYTSYWDAQITGSAWTKNQNIAVAMAGEINFLTDTGNHTPGTGGYQEFIMVAPEPATYALFGMGLILLSLGTFRRRAKKSN